MQIQVDAAQELRAIYDGHVKRLAQLVRPVIENAGKTNAKDLAVAIAAYTSGLLTYHVLFDGVEGVRRRQDGIVESIEASIKALLKSGNGGS